MQVKYVKIYNVFSGIFQYTNVNLLYHMCRHVITVLIDFTHNCVAVF